MRVTSLKFKVHKDEKNTYYCTYKPHSKVLTIKKRENPVLRETVYVVYTAIINIGLESLISSTISIITSKGL